MGNTKSIALLLESHGYNKRDDSEEAKEDFVVRLVEREPSLYKQLPKRLQQREVISQACSRGAALEQVVTDILASNHGTVAMQCISTTLGDKIDQLGQLVYDHPQLYRDELSEPLQQKRLLATRALNGLDDWEDHLDLVEFIVSTCDALNLDAMIWYRVAKLPCDPGIFACADHSIRSDRGTMMEAATHCGVAAYLHFSERLKEDESMALHVLHNCRSQDAAVVRHVLVKCPTARFNRVAWKYIARSGVEDVAIYTDYAPTYILEDDAIMLDACERVGGALVLVSADMMEQTSFVERLLERAGDDRFLLQLSPNVLSAELTIAYLKVGGNPDHLYRILSREHWCNRRVVLEYFATGGLPHEHIHSEFRSDSELCLHLLAMHPTEMMEWMEPSLLEDRSFLLKAVETTPTILEHLTSSRHLYDMLVVVVAHHGIDAFRDYQASSAISSLCVIEPWKFAEYVDGMLAFKHYFDDAYATSVAPQLSLGPDCPIQGLVTEFAGIPTGVQLHNFQKAKAVARELRLDPRGTMKAWQRHHLFEQEKSVVRWKRSSKRKLAYPTRDAGGYPYSNAAAGAP